MPSCTHTSQQSPSNAQALSVDALFEAAFHSLRDPRSTAYKAGARAALAFRIEGKKITRPYVAGGAHSDAFDAGQAEGHAIWRKAITEGDKNTTLNRTNADDAPSCGSHLSPLRGSPAPMPGICSDTVSITIPGLNARQQKWAERFFSVANRTQLQHELSLTQLFVRMIESYAERYPRHKTPSLRLVAGGAK